MKTTGRREFIGSMLALSMVGGCALPKTDGSTGPVTFGVITDLHSGRLRTVGGSKGRFYAQSPAKLAECVGFMNEHRPDFLIELGDMKDAGKDEAETLSFLDEIEAEFRKFKGPRYHVLGNHDEDRISKAQFLGRIENTGFARALPHYAFTVKGIRFIVLDANYNPNGTDYDRGNFDWTKAMVPPTEIRWLREELEASQGPVVIFCHQRLDDPGNPHTVINASEVREVFAAAHGKVKAVFQGHHHTGDFKVVDGVNYVTFKAAVTGPAPEQNAYALVTLHPDGSIEVEGRRTETSRKFTLTFAV